MDQVELTQAYREAVDYLSPHVTYETCKQIAVLDRSMDPDRPFDFVLYLRRSWIRYQRIFDGQPRRGSRWLEVGALFPALPITLSLLGFPVTVVEEYDFYPAKIRAMYDEISRKFGVSFIHANMAASEHVDMGQSFECVSLMGVIEHLPHTPRLLLRNVYAHVADGGRLFLDVPNVHFAPTMLRFLGGGHVQQPIETVYHSGIPFVGHHREYSVRDLAYVLEQAGFAVRRLELFNYSFDASPRDFFSLRRLGHALARATRWREVIFAECQKTVGCRGCPAQAPQGMTGSGREGGIG